MGQEESMRMGRWFGLMAAVAALGLGAAGCGGASGGDKPASSFGHMAGYVWGGNVASVTASWAVPRMAGSGGAHASTWIGSQAPGVAQRSPFIQVGTLEDRASSGGPVYAAFWTDTTRGFHPEVLFHVAPGDVVSTALSRSGGRWSVSIVDSTSAHRASFTTSQEGVGEFNLAEWLQENPSETSGKITAYPRLSTVRMRALAVNGAPPRYADLYAQWMSLRGHNLAPTALREDGFSIVPGVLTPAGRRYLAIAAPQDARARTADREEERWTPQTPAAEIERVSAVAGASEHAYANALARGSWPPSASGPIQALGREVRVEAGLFAAAARRTSGGVDQWRAAFARVSPMLQTLAHDVRRVLHVPELVFGQVPSSAADLPASVLGHRER
jgi:hypothetical protein